MLARNLKDSITQIPDQTAPPRGWAVRSPWARNLLTFLMVFGPGLIVDGGQQRCGRRLDLPAGRRAVWHPSLVDSDRAAADDIFHSGNGRAAWPMLCVHSPVAAFGLQFCF